MSLFQRSLFVLKVRYTRKLWGMLRNCRYRLQGMHIGKNTFLPRLYVTWPHKVSIGKDCILEHNIFFKYDGIWTEHQSIIIADDVFIGNHCEFNISCGLRIGRHSNIASGCKFIDHDHGTKSGMPIGAQAPVQKEIILEQDVWLGANVVVLKGVSIGQGAVVGAGAVVTRSIPANEIWGGIPAKKIAERR